MRKLVAVCAVSAIALVHPRPTVAGAAQDEVNPPEPYGLCVLVAPKDKKSEKDARAGANEITNVFATKNQGKEWRQRFDTWFKMVAECPAAEIVISVTGQQLYGSLSSSSGYAILARVKMPGEEEPKAIRGEWLEKKFLKHTKPAHDMLDRIIKYLRETQPSLVLAHKASAP
jgi:hypothetical protein